MLSLHRFGAPCQAHGPRRPSSDIHPLSRLVRQQGLPGSRDVQSTKVTQLQAGARRSPAAAGCPPARGMTRTACAPLQSPPARLAREASTATTLPACVC